MAKRKQLTVEKLYSKLQKGFSKLLKFPIASYKKLSKKQQMRARTVVLVLLLSFGFVFVTSQYNAGPPRLPQFFNTLTGSTTLDSEKFDIVDSSMIAGDDSCSKKTSQLALLVSDELQTYSNLLYKNLIESTDSNKFVYISIVNDTDDNKDEFERKITSSDHKYFIGSRIFEPVRNNLEDVKDLNGFVQTGQIVLFVFRDPVTYCDNSPELANKTKVDRLGYHLVFAEGKAKDLFPLDVRGIDELIVKKAYVTSLTKSDELLSPNDDLSLNFYWLFSDYKYSTQDLNRMKQTDTDLDFVLNVDDECPDQHSGPNGINGCPDSDADGVIDKLDKCSNTDADLIVDENGCADNQRDSDGDGQNDDVDNDDDNDGVQDRDDNCPLMSNVDQLDTDGDGIGNVCDDDDDNDSFQDAEDNCPLISNRDQLNNDGDANGDACDEDDDNDGVADEDDRFPFDDTESEDIDGDGFGDAFADNCPSTANPDQLDSDNDTVGDVCDPSIIISLVAPDDIKTIACSNDPIYEIELTSILTLDDIVENEFSVANLVFSVDSTIENLEFSKTVNFADADLLTLNADVLDYGLIDSNSKLFVRLNADENVIMSDEFKLSIHPSSVFSHDEDFVDVQTSAQKITFAPLHEFTFDNAELNNCRLAPIQLEVTSTDGSNLECSAEENINLQFTFQRNLAVLEEATYTFNNINFQLKDYASLFDQNNDGSFDTNTFQITIDDQAVAIDNEGYFMIDSLEVIFDEDSNNSSVDLDLEIQVNNLDDRQLIIIPSTNLDISVSIETPLLLSNQYNLSVPLDNSSFYILSEGNVNCLNDLADVLELRESSLATDLFCSREGKVVSPMRLQNVGNFITNLDVVVSGDNRDLIENIESIGLLSLGDSEMISGENKNIFRFKNFDLSRQHIGPLKYTLNNPINLNFQFFNNYIQPDFDINILGTSLNINESIIFTGTDTCLSNFGDRDLLFANDPIPANNENMLIGNLDSIYHSGENQPSDISRVLVQGEFDSNPVLESRISDPGRFFVTDSSAELYYYADDTSEYIQPYDLIINDVSYETDEDVKIIENECREDGFVKVSNFVPQLMLNNKKWIFTTNQQISSNDFVFKIINSRNNVVSTAQILNFEEVSQVVFSDLILDKNVPYSLVMQTTFSDINSPSFQTYIKGDMQLYFEDYSVFKLQFNLNKLVKDEDCGDVTIRSSRTNRYEPFPSVSNRFGDDRFGNFLETPLAKVNEENLPVKIYQGNQLIRSYSYVEALSGYHLGNFFTGDRHNTIQLKFMYQEPQLDDDNSDLEYLYNVEEDGFFVSGLVNKDTLVYVNGKYIFLPFEDSVSCEREKRIVFNSVSSTYLDTLYESEFHDRDRFPQGHDNIDTINQRLDIVETSYFNFRDFFTEIFTGNSIIKQVNLNSEFGQYSYNLFDADAVGLFGPQFNRYRHNLFDSSARDFSEVEYFDLSSEYNRFNRNLTGSSQDTSIDFQNDSDARDDESEVFTYAAKILDHSGELLPDSSLEVGIYSPRGLRFKLFDFENTLYDDRVDFSTPHIISQRNTQHCSLFEFFAIQRLIGDTRSIEDFIELNNNERNRDLEQRFFYREDNALNKVLGCLRFWSDLRFEDDDGVRNQSITLPPTNHSNDYRTINFVLEDTLGCETDYIFKFCHVSSFHNYDNNLLRNWNVFPPTDRERECFDTLR